MNRWVFQQPANARSKRLEPFESVRHNAAHLLEVLRGQVLKQEELHVAPIVLEEREETAVTTQCGAQRTAFGSIMPTDALERQVAPIVYPIVRNCSLSVVETWPMIPCIDFHRVYLGITESLPTANSPR